MFLEKFPKLLFQDLFEQLFASLFAVGIGLMVTATLLFITRISPPGEKQLEAMKKIEPGQGSFQAMSELYTEAHRETIQKVMPRRQ